MFTDLLLKIFVPGLGEEMSPEIRTRCGIVSGITGIACNLFLVAVKLALAVFSGSIAVAADAVNNLSDAGSGIITAAGFKLAGRPADAEHPFGHGRTEYVAGLVVALLITGLGITLLKDSIVSIFRPSPIKSDTVTIVIFSATILVKCWLFLFYRKVGILLRSDVIRASAFDSLSDCLGTGLVVLSLILSRFTTFPVDGCAGIIVALMVLWAGGNVLKDTVNKLLGEPPDPALVEKLKCTLLACPEIDGIHDLIIHNYGANSYYATAHAEICCEGDRQSAHDILEKAEVSVEKTLPVHILLHGDPYDKHDPEVIRWRGRMENAIAGFDTDLRLYDFRLKNGGTGKDLTMNFHLLLPHRYRYTEEDVRRVLAEKMAVYGENLVLDIVFLKSFVES